MKEARVIRIAILSAAVIGLAAGAALAAEAPRMKMTTDIPESIIMPDKIETRIGTLELFDGFPNDETVQKLYDEHPTAFCRLYLAEREAPGAQTSPNSGPSLSINSLKRRNVS